MSEQAGKTTLSRKERLLAERAAIDARIKGVEAKERAEAKAAETRKTFSAGDALLAEAEDDEVFRSQIMAIIERRLRDNRRRKDFGFVELPEEGAVTLKKAAAKKPAPEEAAHDHHEHGGGGSGKLKR